jgi:hypothetical protein
MRALRLLAALLLGLGSAVAAAPHASASLQASVHVSCAAGQPLRVIGPFDPGGTYVYPCRDGTMSRFYVDAGERVTYGSSGHGIRSATGGRDGRWYGIDSSSYEVYTIG